MVSKKIIASIVLATITMIITVGTVGAENQDSQNRRAKKQVTENPQQPSILQQVPFAGNGMGGPTRVTPTPAKLFYNYYAPTQGGGIPAGIYPAPRHVPIIVGHTYNTYQPLMPHEFMYRHYRAYHHYYNNGMGFTRTRVIYK